MKDKINYNDGQHLTNYGIKILQKTKKHILENAKRVDMGSWRIDGLDPGKIFRNSRGELSKSPACGTVACIGGWVDTLSRKTLPVGIEVRSVSARASFILGFEPHPGSSYNPLLESLFMPSGWPQPYKERLYRKKIGTKAYAKVVADRIQKFIDTRGEV